MFLTLNSSIGQLYKNFIQKFHPPPPPQVEISSYSYGIPCAVVDKVFNVTLISELTPATSKQTLRARLSSAMSSDTSYVGCSKLISAAEQNVQNMFTHMILDSF